MRAPSACATQSQASESAETRIDLYAVNHREDLRHTVQVSSSHSSMEYITEVRGKEDRLEGFVGRSPLLVHEPSGEPSSTRAPGDNADIAKNEAGSPCSTSTDILPDGQGSNAAESHFLSLLLPQKAPPNTSVATDPTKSTGTTGHVVDEWYYAHTRRPRRSFSADFKLKAVAYYKQGNTKAATAKFFGIHRKRIQEWIQQESSLRCSPSNKRRMTQTMVSSSKEEKGELQSEGSVEGADSSPFTASERSAESDLSHTGAFTHIQTLTTLPLVAPQASCADVSVSSGSDVAMPTSGGMLAGKDVTMQNTVSIGSCGGVPLVQPTRATHSPIPSAHTTPPPIPATPTTSSPILPAQTTPSPAQNSSSQMPTSRATLESNIIFLRTLSDETIGTLLDAMNLSKYKAKFLAEQVDGELLSSLRQSELRELGIESGLHQLKLLKLVQGIYSAETFLSKLR